MSPTSGGSLIGKLAYGFAFVVVLPLFLIAWAVGAEPAVILPVIYAPAAGWLIAAFGTGLMILGMSDLIRRGKGLPMNAYPPSQFVTEGAYRFIAHPIYTGFSLISAGVAVAFGSRSGLWLVTPVVILGCVALVEGFERPDLAARFGDSLPKPLLCLPENAERPAYAWERISVYLLVLLPWLVLYEACANSGQTENGFGLFLPFERQMPVYESWELLYALAYPFVFLVPLSGASARTLRKFSIAGLAATGIGVLMFITLPIVAVPRSFAPTNVFGELLLKERAFDSAAAAFPSFHAAWTLLAAYAYARAYPSLRYVWWIAAALICASCILTGMHAAADVVAGVCLAWAGLNVKRVWCSIRNGAERIANSWREWRIGPMRIINHGWYAGAGTFLGVAAMGILLGHAYVFPLFFTACCSLICSALWAQIIEGSPSLLRPYGFYGGVLGVAIGVCLLSFMGESAWLLLAAFAVAGPLIQSMGRLRCLVQGCCHGREASPLIGVAYTHPRSRVTRLTSFGGKPLHPTPVYSILWNVCTGLVTARLYLAGAAPPLIAGLYLILNGLGRFVEEAYRGEPQTPVLGKLRLYQLMAIASVLCGAAMTTIQTLTVLPAPEFSWSAIVSAALFGAITAVALGVDFPESNRRFARLA